MTIMMMMTITIMMTIMVMTTMVKMTIMMMMTLVVVMINSAWTYNSFVQVFVLIRQFSEFSRGSIEVDKTWTKGRWKTYNKQHTLWLKYHLKY